MMDMSQLLFQGQPTPSKVYNVGTNYPLIQNSQEYEFYKKYVSIHSEDRNILKFPRPNEFEIELPEDLLNVLSVRLVHWTFPANYDTFSPTKQNVSMTFKINNPFNPSEQGYSIPLYDEIYKCLFLSADQDFLITIQDGFYSPGQIVTELTNRFNYAVTLRIIDYFSDTTGPNYNPDTFPSYLNEFKLGGGYMNFIVVYNAVSQNVWFGNTTDGFVLTNLSQAAKPYAPPDFLCASKNTLPDYTDWGLPGYLGLSRTDMPSTSGTPEDALRYGTINGVITPRFYFGDVLPGDAGYWLLPNPVLPGSKVNWVQASYKINLMGPAYIYMEIEGLNCIDETSPFNLSPFTIKTNQTNGVVNAAFAKMAVPTTPISQWFDRDAVPYKEFVPPAERIRRLNIKIRYHTNEPVDFGVFNYSFLLEFTVCQPHQQRKYKSALSGIPGK
jgi:hypothetical protein